MVSYQSGFADLIEKYVFYQESSGSWSEVRARNLRYFDRFCAERFPGRALCQEMVDAWCQKRDTETKSSCITRTGVIRSFISYLQKRRMTDVLPMPVPKAEKRTRVPHAFTREELQNFFHECDSIVPYNVRRHFKWSGNCTVAANKNLPIKAVTHTACGKKRHAFFLHRTGKAV